MCSVSTAKCQDEVTDLGGFSQEKLGICKIKSEDIVEMEYNDNKKTLIYKINDIERLLINVANYIRPSLYNAKLVLFRGISCWQYELLSYQMTY